MHELGDDPNLYAYVHGRALVAVDPNGQFAWVPFLIGIGVALAIEGVRQHYAIKRGEQDGFNAGSFVVAGVAATAGGALGAVAGPALGQLAARAGGQAFGLAVGTLGGGAVGGLAGGTTSRAGRGIAEGRAADEVLADTFAPANLAMDAGLGMGSAAAGYAAGRALGWARNALRGGEAATSGGSASTAPGGAGPGPVADDVVVRAPGEGGCFVAGTEIPTSEGVKAIETLHIGDQVLTRDPSTKEISYRPIVRTFVHQNKALVKVTVDAPSSATMIEATPGHPFFVQDRGWIGAGDLAPGDRLSLASGEWVAVVGVSPEVMTSTVYNFEVDGTHTYFVSKAVIWVHNQSRSGLTLRGRAMPQAGTNSPTSVGETQADAPNPAPHELVPSVQPPGGNGIKSGLGELPRDLRAPVYDALQDIQASRAGDPQAMARLSARAPHALTANRSGWTSVDITGRQEPQRLLYRIDHDGAIRWDIVNTHARRP